MSSDVKGWVTLWLLAIFLVLWVWTEWAEYGERDEFTQAVTDFIEPGARFTAADGEALEKRVEALEKSSE